MLFVKSLIFLWSFNLAFSQKKKDFTCVPMDFCQCMFQNGLGINLNGLNVTFITTEAVFIFHPCFNIVPPDAVLANHTATLNECQGGSSLCFYKPLDLNHFQMINLGKADSIKFQTNIDGTEISLISNYNSWLTTIHLECSTQAEEGALAVSHIDLDKQKIEMSLVSKESCLTNEFSSIRLGGWTVVSITIGTFLLVYFVGGALLIRFLFGAEGAEMIPHYSFWNTALSRLKEIPAYCSNCCRSSNGYDEI